MADIKLDDIDEKNGELEGLRSKNRELLNEVKQLKIQLRELQASAVGDNGETEKLKAELLEFKTRDGWSAITKHSGVLPEMVKYMRQELGANLSIGEDGSMQFVNAEGKILTDSKGRDLSPLEVDDVRLLTESVREKFPAFWPRPTGTGAVGNGHGRAVPPTPETDEPVKQEKPASFGLK